MGNKTGKKQGIYQLLDQFIDDLYSDGTVKRWEEQREIVKVSRKHQQLNRSIKENQVIMDCLN
jgi:hypothetical protein